LRREAAAREVDELNDLHQAEIALARANVVNCDMAARVRHKAVMAETTTLTTQRAELEAANATDRRIAAAMQPRWRATPPESEPEEPTESSDIESSEEEPTDSSDVESSSEENSWELTAGGISAAAAAPAEEEEEKEK
jgi:hypothetical protein